MKKQKKGIKLTSCVKCGKVFNKSYKLTDHIKNCVPVRCAICDKEYTWRRINQIRLHVKYVENSIAEMNTSRPIRTGNILKADKSG